MRNLCPTCRRRFEEAGFCPFDGTPLATSLAPGPPQESPTTQSVLPPPASAGADNVQDPPTQLELRRQTFPLTPTPAAGTRVGSIDSGDSGPQQSTDPTHPAGRVPLAETRPTGNPLAGNHLAPLVPPAGSGAITAKRLRSAPEPGLARVRAPSEPHQIRAQSASEDPNEALELYRGPRENEYDKLVGQTLDGRYYIESKLGEGGMGVVFGARHAVIERPLAIKVLKRDAMRDTATIRRFVQEAKAASRIGHPNIVDVTDFGTTPDGMTYSVMEFVPGKTLGAALRLDAPFPPARAIRITAQIARALAAAHDKGIVHRDLKPENVFLIDRDGRQDFVKIVDFGIAKVTPPSGQAAEPRLTRAGSVFGTPEYMAPEQAAGRGDTDGRADIYALGVLLYEMICGRVPHRSDSMVRTLAMQMLDPIEPPSKRRPDLAIAPALEAIVMHALAKNREQRYQTMGELLDALDAILPPPVGLSVTGSPVYALAALPPGADPGIVPSVPAMPPQSSEAAAPPSHPATQQGVQPARSSSTTRRIKDEPEFTADERPPSFQHVFTEDLAPAPRRRWPRLVLAAMIVAGAAGAVALAIRSRRAVVTDAPRDANFVALTGDAMTEHAPVDAAAVDTTPDAADLLVVPELDAGQDAGRTVRPSVPHDAGAPVIPAIADTPNHRGTIQVQITTKPEGADLYDDEQHYRGTGGGQVEEPSGTRRTFTCKQRGYKPGTIEVSFTEDSPAVICVLKRIKICINGIKNPFDDCEIDPSDSLMAPDAPSAPPSP